MNSGADAPTPSTRLFLLLYVAPVVLLLAITALPLATGARTLYQRDVFGTQLEMKAAQAESMRRGYLPLIDPYRAGGQPALGNPNTVPLHPDNLLYLVTPTLWALNAHFWIHLLIAPFAMAWLGRAWGLRREAAWTAGLCYGLSGYVLSHLMFYNQIAGVALAPALVAACLRFAEGRARRAIGVAVALLWTLLLLGGEPILAVLALILALSCVAVRHGLHARVFLRLGLLLLCGTLIAAPQIVELLRIVGLSYRGHLGYSSETRTVASWDPRQIVEWLLPFAFGRPDRLDAGGFWGHRFFTGHPPYYFSLYPGLLTLSLVVAALRSGRALRWPLGAAAAGLFLALGRFNPAVAWLFDQGAGLVRYPVRMWLPVAIGGALLAGIGYEMCFQTPDPRARRGLVRALVALAIVFLVARLALSLLSARAVAWVAGLMPPTILPGSAEAAVARWTLLCTVSLGLSVLLAIAAVIATRLPGAGGAMLLTLHAASQLALLAPLMSTDASKPYQAASPLLAAIPADATVAHGGSEGLFGADSPAPRRYPGHQGYWFARRAFFEAYPFAGELQARHYELNVSSEGLDSFLSTAARDAVRLADDRARLRLLAAWGTNFLILDRPLDHAASDLVDPVLSLPSFGGAIDLYRIKAAAPRVFVAGTVLRAPTLNAAVKLLEEPSFDPSSMVVLPGQESTSIVAPGAPAVTHVVMDEPERLVAETETSASGVLVVQRAFLPLYRATIDGSPAPLRVANLHRIGIEVPAGRHRVELRVDRGPFHLSLCAVALGFLGLVVLVRGPRPDGMR